MNDARSTAARLFSCIRPNHSRAGADALRVCLETELVFPPLKVLFCSLLLNYRREKVNNAMNAQRLEPPETNLRAHKRLTSPELRGGGGANAHVSRPPLRRRGFPGARGASTHCKSLPMVLVKMCRNLHPPLPR